MSSSSFFVFRFLYNPDYSYIMTAQDIQNYRSARMGLCKKSSYASRIPSSNSVWYCQPSALALLTSKSFLGVPLGLLASQRISPS